MEELIIKKVMVGLLGVLMTSLIFVVLCQSVYNLIKEITYDFSSQDTGTRFFLCGIVGLSLFGCCLTLIFIYLSFRYLLS